MVTLGTEETERAESSTWQLMVALIVFKVIRSIQSSRRPHQVILRSIFLYAGYSCYKCTYFIKGNHCAIVEDCGPDIRELESRTVAPNGVCTLWHPNEMETR
jgi:hypothetical protein